MSVNAIERHARQGVLRSPLLLWHVVGSVALTLTSFTGMVFGPARDSTEEKIMIALVTVVLLLIAQLVLVPVNLMLLMMWRAVARRFPILEYNRIVRSFCLLVLVAPVFGLILQFGMILVSPAKLEANTFWNQYLHPRPLAIIMVMAWVLVPRFVVPSLRGSIADR